MTQTLFRDTTSNTATAAWRAVLSSMLCCAVVWCPQQHGVLCCNVLPTAAWRAVLSTAVLSCAVLYSAVLYCTDSGTTLCCAIL